MDIEELISNGSMASTTAGVSPVQKLEAELTTKTEQIENFEGRQVNMLRDGRSEFSLGDADAAVWAENVERGPGEAVAQHKQQMQRIVNGYQTLFILSSKS